LFLKQRRDENHVKKLRTVPLIIRVVEAKKTPESSYNLVTGLLVIILVIIFEVVVF